MLLDKVWTTSRVAIGALIPHNHNRPMHMDSSDPLGTEVNQGHIRL